MAHGTGYKGGRQPEIGSEPGVGRLKRNGSNVGVGVSFWTSKLVTATTGVGLKLTKFVQAVREKIMRRSNLHQWN